MTISHVSRHPPPHFVTMHSIGERFQSNLRYVLLLVKLPHGPEVEEGEFGTSFKSPLPLAPSMVSSSSSHNVDRSCGKGDVNTTNRHIASTSKKTSPTSIHRLWVSLLGPARGPVRPAEQSERLVHDVLVHLDHRRAVLRVLLLQLRPRPDEDVIHDPPARLPRYNN